MAAKKAPGRHPETPSWLTAAAARLNRVNEDFVVQMIAADLKKAIEEADDDDMETHPASSSSAAAPSTRQERVDRVVAEYEAKMMAIRQARGRVEPTATRWGDFRAPASVIGKAAFSAGLEPRDLPRVPQEELAALRFAGAKPQSFAPWRHAIMVCGRPVVALT